MIKVVPFTRKWLKWLKVKSQVSSADCGGDDDGSDDGGDVGIPARVTNDTIYPTTDKTYPTTDINYSTIGKYFAVSERYVNKFSPCRSLLPLCARFSHTRGSKNENPE